LERPGSALLASILVHAAVVLGVIGFGMLGFTRTPLRTEMAVPVSIISDTIVEAAAADNPSEELVTEDAATAPVAPTPPEPVPPEPVPPPPTPTPVRKGTPPRPPLPPRQPPPRPPQPPRPPSPRPPERGFLEGLIQEPSPRPGPRAPTGQQGQGTAPRAVGRASLQALGAQVRPSFSCTLPGVENLQIRVSVRLRESGELNGAPRLLPPQGGDGYSAVSAAVIRAIYAAAPFDMPPDYEEQTMTFTFPAARYC